MLSLLAQMRSERRTTLKLVNETELFLGEQGDDEINCVDNYLTFLIAVQQRSSNWEARGLGRSRNWDKKGVRNLAPSS